ncbi:MAG: hypothetical protein K2M96_01255 [Prevotella sp.]|nr:hypothetical protein [Prevotella sp.]
MQTLLCALLRTADKGYAMRRPHPHHAPTASAPCADRVRIMCRARPHRVPTVSARCAPCVAPICFVG